MNDGILIIDKPADWTSHDVVGKLRKLLGTKRIGHTGTLDPFATGVLVMLVGQATRLARFLDKDRKEYEATIRFGFETDSGDLTGGRTTESGLTDDEIAHCLEKVDWEDLLRYFRGSIMQIPPMYSAKKVDGRKLYELARKGVEIERKAVSVTIHTIELLERNPDSQSLIRIRVECSAGTYIRTLAEDIGRRLGIPCHLSQLRRTRAGKFDLSQAAELENIEKNSVFITMNEALSHLPEVRLDDEEIRKIRNGMRLKCDLRGEFVRLIDIDRNLIAVGLVDENFVRPKIVFV